MTKRLEAREKDRLGAPKRACEGQGRFCLSW